MGKSNAKSKHWGGYKVGVYKAAIESIAMYGAELWGMKVNNELEAVQRYFYKRLMGLPTYTPNYIFETELGLSLTHTKTILRKLNYEKKIRSNEEQRKYTSVIARELDRLGIGYIEELKEALAEMGIETDVDVEKDDFEDITIAYKLWAGKKNRDELFAAARLSISRLLYPCLNLSL